MGSTLTTCVRRLAIGLLASAAMASVCVAGSPPDYGAYAPPPYAFPYPRPSLKSTPHLKNPKYYTHMSQKYPGRWVWLLPSYHEIMPTHRGYYDNYLQLQFLRDY